MTRNSWNNTAKTSVIIIYKYRNIIKIWNIMIIYDYMADLNPICCSPVTCCDTTHHLQIKIIGLFAMCFHAKLSHSGKACHSFIGKLVCQLLSLQGRECWSEGRGEHRTNDKMHTMKCWCLHLKKNKRDTSTCIDLYCSSVFSNFLSKFHFQCLQCDLEPIQDPLDVV